MIPKNTETNPNDFKKGRGFAGQKMIVLPQKLLRELKQNLLLKTLFITHIGYFPKAKFHYRERNEGIDEYILIYCTDGEGWYEIDQKKFTVEPNSWFALPANISHRYGANTENPWSIYWIHFTGSKADRFMNFNESSHYEAPRLITYTTNRIQIFEEMYQTLERGYSIDNLGYANTCLWRFLGSFIFSNTHDRLKSQEEKNWVEVSISFMKNNLHRSLSLKEVAQKVHYSSSYFSTRFKKETGYSPIDYFIHLKIQKACQFLDLTDLNINEIAQKLGYNDNHYFSRLFHKTMGLPPSTYRKKQKG